MDGSISRASLLSVDRIMSSLEVEQELYFSGGDNKLLSVILSQTAMHCHGVVLVLVLTLSSGSFLAGDHCPECQEIFRKCFVCDIDVSKLKKLEVAKYKPEPPVVEKLFDGNILSKSL